MISNDVQPELPVLIQENRDNPAIVDTLTVVGILGKSEDAPLLYPFLESTNDYVIVGAAKSLIRLGDKNKALVALVHLTDQNPKEYLPYITEALHILKEMQYPQYRELL